ncbi:MAG TPA: hypothetical protein VF516_03195 [Kofleriaceae bacterium]
MPLTVPDQTIATQIQTPDAMKSISGLLNAAGSMQQVRSQGIDLQKKEQANKERLAVQQFMSNPDNFQTNGRIDLDKVNKAIPSIAPLTGSEVIDKLSTLSQNQTQALEAKQKLTQSQRAIVAGPIGVLGRAGINDPAAYARELQSLKETNPDNPDLHRLIDAYSNTLKLVPAGEHVSKTAVKASQSLMSPDAQQTSLTPTVGLTNTGGALAETISTPSVAGNAPSITMTGRQQPLTLSPGSQETMQTDQLGNPIVVTKSPQGTIVNTRPAPGAGVGLQLRPGDAQAIPVLEAERTSARNILSSAPIAHTTNKGILDELNNVISTGQTGGFMAKVASITGASPVGGTDAERAASAYDLIGKYTERNALEAAKAMGPGTNAGLEAAIKANGSAAYNPTALKKITKLNDAIVSGAEMYQPGLEKAISANPQRGVLAKREFDQAWAQNFDPLVMQIHNAQQAGDKAELQDLIKSIGGKDSARAKDVIRRAKNLEKLSADGRL